MARSFPTDLSVAPDPLERRSLCERDQLIVLASGGRPPPDYGPYQGPGGGRRRH